LRRMCEQSLSLSGRQLARHTPTSSFAEIEFMSLMPNPQRMARTGARRGASLEP
jgi:hypothetical protein